MKFWVVLLFLLSSMGTSALADAQLPGVQGFNALKHCVMENDIPYCRSILTPDSVDIFNRFASYKLMPCLPTDFKYVSEQTVGVRTTVTANMPAGPTTNYILRVIFDNTAAGPKLNVPESLHRGLGEHWENKIQLSEQVYLMMRQNMGDKLTCDALNNLIQPKN